MVHMPRAAGRFVPPARNDQEQRRYDCAGRPLNPGQGGLVPFFQHSHPSGPGLQAGEGGLLECRIDSCRASR